MLFPMSTVYKPPSSGFYTFLFSKISLAVKPSLLNCFDFWQLQVAPPLNFQQRNTVVYCLFTLHANIFLYYSFSPINQVAPGVEMCATFFFYFIALKYNNRQFTPVRVEKEKKTRS